MSEQKGWSSWTSQERAKFLLDVASLVVSTAIAIGIFIVSQQIDAARIERDGQQKRQDAERSRQEKINDKKIALWDQMGPQLNRIFQYVTYVGDWKHIRSSEVIAAKRKADEMFYTYRPFFSDSFAQSYDAFMRSSFQMWNGMGDDARIRTSPGYRIDEAPGRFADDYDLSKTFTAYYALLRAAGDDFGLTVSTPAQPKAPVPTKGGNTVK